MASLALPRPLLARCLAFWRALFAPAPLALAGPRTPDPTHDLPGEPTPIALARGDTPAPPSRRERANRSGAAARIIAAFDSAHPVEERDRLHGRDEMLDALFDAVLLNRQHALIHGARGSGKTSLARIFGDYADGQGAVVIYTACEATSSFAELLRPYLSFLPASAIPFASRASFETERDALPAEFGPRVAVDLLSRLDPDTQIILILDEFDRVQNAAVHAQVATFLKLLSDTRLPVQLLVVGIAGTVDDLIDCHPSLRRHMLPVAVGRISSAHTVNMIEVGARRAGIAFDEDSKRGIVNMACGSPYHVQLFCYVAAIEAARQGSATVDLDLLHRGAARAFEVWATLNGQDAALFRLLATESGDRLEAVRAAARSAALHDTLADEGLGAQLLAPALRADGQSGRLCFRDSAAPQFLLAVTALAASRQQRDEDDEEPAATAMPSRRVA